MFQHQTLSGRALAFDAVLPLPEAAPGRASAARRSPETARPWLNRGGALVAAIFLLCSVAMVLAMTGAFSAATGGVLYPLDDSYIHLALARTLAEHGVWGLQPDQPSSASSSPLWSVLLAAVNWVASGLSRTAFSWVPLLANIAAGVALVLFWRRRFDHLAEPALATLVLIALVPLPAIALIGMEHVLHMLLATVLAWSAAVAIEQGAAPTRRQLAWIAALSAAAVGARYESLALVAGLALIALLRRRWSLVPALLLPAALVVIGFGLLWVKTGGWWLPNSFLLKTDIGQHPEFSGLLGRIDQHLRDLVNGGLALLMLALTAMLTVLLVALRRCETPERALLAAALVATVGQVLFGKLGWLFRYEAWLIALDGFSIILALHLLFPKRRVMFGIITGCLLLIGWQRSTYAVAHTVLAAHDREWEHFAPTRALAGYAGEPLLVNDIGVISYYGSGRPIDIYGLADNRTLRLKREGRLDAAGLAAFAREQDARVGEFQLCWTDLRRGLPAGWRLVEAWTGQRNVVFGDLTVAFMARDEGSARRLRSELARAPVPAGVRRFGEELPLVRAYNANPDKGQAAARFCNAASLVATGTPDPLSFYEG